MMLLLDFLDYLWLGFWLIWKFLFLWIKMFGLVHHRMIIGRRLNLKTFLLLARPTNFLFIITLNVSKFPVLKKSHIIDPCIQEQREHKNNKILPSSAIPPQRFRLIHNSKLTLYFNMKSEASVVVSNPMDVINNFSASKNINPPD